MQGPCHCLRSLLLQHITNNSHAICTSLHPGLLPVSKIVAFNKISTNVIQVISYYSSTMKNSKKPLRHWCCLPDEVHRTNSLWVADRFDPKHDSLWGVSTLGLWTRKGLRQRCWYNDLHEPISTTCSGNRPTRKSSSCMSLSYWHLNRKICPPPRPPDGTSSCLCESIWLFLDTYATVDDCLQRKSTNLGSRLPACRCLLQVFQELSAAQFHQMAPVLVFVKAVCWSSIPCNWWDVFKEISKFKNKEEKELRKNN